MRAGAATRAKIKIAIAFQFRLFVFSRVMNFFSSKFSALELLFLFRKMGPKRKIPPPE
jgi:hypothetical protein